MDTAARPHGVLAVLLPAALRIALWWLRERERRSLDREIANGWPIDEAATPATIHPADKARFALAPDESYEELDVSDGEWHGVVRGGEGLAGGVGSALSPWAVWTTAQLLTPDECRRWIERAEAEGLEKGDFIFKTGRGRFERMATGVRRQSLTRLIEDPSFVALLEARLRSSGAVPAELADGRSFRGVRSTFLITRYEPGHYFAPHFDGCTVAREDTDGGAVHGSVGAFTCVLYLSAGFGGGATHYLPGQGSEVARAVAVRPNPGCAVIHRAVSVMHAGGHVERGQKHIMQFSLCYDAPEDAAAARALLKPLRWGA